MILEYAVEPAAIGADWETFIVMIERFGVDKGRLISQWPYRKGEKWISKVTSEAKKNLDIGDVKISSMKARMRRPVKVADFCRDIGNYNSDISWIDNIEHENSRRPFYLIACKDEAVTLEGFTTTNKFIDDPDHSETNSSCDVELTSGKISDTLLPVVLISKEVNIVDPYFNITLKSRNYLDPLISLFDKLEKLKCPAKTIRFHFSWEPQSGSENPNIFLENNKSALQQYIPAGYTVELIAWTTRLNGQKFHNRYCLTDLVGLQSGEGFAEENKNTTDTYSLLSNSDRLDLLKMFSDDSQVYDQAGKLRITSSNGNSN